MSPGHHEWTPPTVPPKSENLPHSPEPSRFESAKEPIIAHPLEHRPNNKNPPDRDPGQLTNIHTSPRIVTSHVSGDTISPIHPYSSHPLAPASMTTAQARAGHRQNSPVDLHSGALSPISSPTAVPRLTGTTVTHGSTATENPPNAADPKPLDSPAPSSGAREPSGMQKLFEVIRAKPTLTRTWEKRTYIEELRSAPLRPLTENGMEEGGGRRTSERPSSFYASPSALRSFRPLPQTDPASPGHIA